MDRHSAIRARAHAALGEQTPTYSDIYSLYDLLDRLSAKVDGEEPTPHEATGIGW
jgi:hypothetical protein